MNLPIPYPPLVGPTVEELRAARADYLTLGDGTDWEAERVAELEAELAARQT